MLHDNKSIVKRFLTQVWEEENLDIINEVLSEDFIDHDALEQLPSNREGFRQFTRLYLGAFSNLELDIKDLIAEGDKVVVRWYARGLHDGEFMDISPTNNRVEMSGIDIVRFSDGKIVERWGEFDQAGLLQQLGVMPEPEMA